MVEQNARRCLEIAHRGYVLDQGRNAYTGTGAELLADEKVVELYLGTLARDARRPGAMTPGLRVRDDELTDDSAVILICGGARDVRVRARRRRTPTRRRRRSSGSCSTR